MTAQKAEHRDPCLAQVNGLIEPAVLKNDPAGQIVAFEVERSCYPRPRSLNTRLPFAGSVSKSRRNPPD